MREDNSKTRNTRLAAAISRCRIQMPDDDEFLRDLNRGTGTWGFLLVGPISLLLTMVPLLVFLLD